MTCAAAGRRGRAWASRPCGPRSVDDARKL